MPLHILLSKTIPTPLGKMVAIGDQNYLYLLEFLERKTLDKQICRLKNLVKGEILDGECKSTHFIEEELGFYFAGGLKEFRTPVKMFGTEFRKSVWKALSLIPYGKTQSYKDLASSLRGHNHARAVANACGANSLAIVIPCHRVIQANLKMGGYSGGLEIKPKLLDLEKTSK